MRCLAPNSHFRPRAVPQQPGLDADKPKFKTWTCISAMGRDASARIDTLPHTRMDPPGFGSRVTSGRRSNAAPAARFKRACGALLTGQAWLSTHARERDSGSRARVRAAAEPWQTGRRATHSQLARLGTGRLAPRRKTVAPAAAALPSAPVAQTSCPGRHGSRTGPAGRAGPMFPHLRR